MKIPTIELVREKAMPIKFEVKMVNTIKLADDGEGDNCVETI